MNGSGIDQDENMEHWDVCQPNELDIEEWLDIDEPADIYVLSWLRASVRSMASRRSPREECAPSKEGELKSKSS